MSTHNSSAPHSSLPIWRDVDQLLLDVEQAVCRIPRDHKYVLGIDLRRQAMTLCSYSVRRSARR